MSPLTNFFNVFLAAVTLFYYSDIDPNFRPIDVPVETLQEEYDFIIVGAGSAGAVLANRLAEVPEWSVLLLEAGGDETAISDVPTFNIFLANTDLEWNYTTTPQPNACLATNNGQCSWPRGHVMGGSSAVNAMIYVRGNRQDYDNWELMGSTGWNYENILPYFLRAEDNRIPSLYNSPYHRTGGFLTVSQPSYQTQLVPIFAQATKELGFDIVDYNGASQKGFSISQATLRDGSRCSTSKGYLRPIRAQRNLNVVMRALVSKILIDDNNNAYGVQYTQGNKLYTAKARKEVISSAGAVNTPQLLMLSGIGPEEVLNKFGIPVIKNLPVGSNLQDHISVPLVFQVEGVNTITPSTLRNFGNVLQYTQNQSGPLTIPSFIEFLGFINSNPDSNDGPDLQFMFVSFFPSPQNLNLFAIIPVFLHPASRGYVTIQSADIYTPPVMNPKYFSSSPDFNMLLTGAFIGLNITKTESLKAFNATLYADFYTPCREFEPGTKQFLTCAIEQFTTTVYHPVGTCKMGQPSDPSTVVNPQLQVHGIKNLRVIDASVMPTITSGNTNAPTVAIAERASDLIKMYWGETKTVLPLQYNYDL